MMNSISFVIPAYNESATIEKVVCVVDAYAYEHKKVYEIIVVNDGSIDETYQKLCELQKKYPFLRCIHLKHNQGKGSAVKKGVLASRYEWIVFLDADLSTHPNELLAIEERADGADIYMGSRAVQGSKLVKRQSILRQTHGKLFNRVMRMLFNLQFHDTQCGFKVFHRKTKHIFEQLVTKGWIFDVEFIVRAQKSGYTVLEVPISWTNDPHTKMRFSHSIQILRDIIRLKKIL